MNRFHGVPFRFYATSYAREALEAKVPNSVGSIGLELTDPERPEEHPDAERGIPMAG